MLSGAAVEALRQRRLQLQIDAAVEEIAERRHARLLHQRAEVGEVLLRRRGRHHLGDDRRQDQPCRVGAEELAVRLAVGPRARTGGGGDLGGGDAVFLDRRAVGIGEMLRGVPDHDRRRGRDRVERGAVEVAAHRHDVVAPGQHRLASGRIGDVLLQPRDGVLAGLHAGDVLAIRAAHREKAQRRAADGERPHDRMGMSLHEAGIDHLVLEAVVDRGGIGVCPGLQIVKRAPDRNDAPVGDSHGRRLRPAGVHGHELFRGEDGDGPDDPGRGRRGLRRRHRRGGIACRPADLPGRGIGSRHDDRRGRQSPRHVHGDRFAEHRGQFGDAIGSPARSGGQPPVFRMDADRLAIPACPMRRDDILAEAPEWKPKASATRG